MKRDYHDRDRNRGGDNSTRSRNSRERERPREANRDNPFKHREESAPQNDNRRDERQFRENRAGRDRGDNRPRSGRREEDGDNYQWGRDGDKKKEEEEEPVAEKEKPNFGLSGKLNEDKNTVNGVVLKYAEPPEARRPKRRWRLYPFKGEQALQTLHIHRQSCYLIGRDKKVCEIPVDHPSCSKQHAALQYRLVPYERDDGSTAKRVRPYIIDLESANGTYVNNQKIDPKKYVELLERDVLKFGFSTREYVLLHENSNNEADDDVALDEARMKSEPRDDE